MTKCFSRLLLVCSELEIRFLKDLVAFGGATTREMYQLAARVKDQGNAHKRLQKLVSRGILVKKSYSKIDARLCDLYFPSRGLGIYYGCERKIPKNLEFAFEKYLRFCLIFYSHGEGELVTYVHGPSLWPFSKESLEKIRNKRVDDMIVGTQVVMLLLPTWSRKKVANRLDIWSRVEPKPSVKFWWPDVPNIGEQIKRILPQKFPLKIDGSTRFKDSFAPIYFEVMNQLKNINFRTQETAKSAS